MDHPQNVSSLPGTLLPGSDAAWRADAGSRPGIFSRAARALPSLLVFTGLAGVLAWGHWNGWAVPSFSALTGRPGEQSEKWCDAHNVAEVVCVECNPDLMPRSQAFGWCKLHGVHECPLCHPELAQTAQRPEVTAADRDRAQRALAFTDRPENSSKCKLHQRRIQFGSREAVERAGVEIEPVWRAPMVEFVSGSGETSYDQTRTARLSARVPGTVFRALKQVGDPVRRGEVVALVDAAEVGRVKSELLQALVQSRLKRRVLDQLRSSRDSVSERVVLEMETALNEARIRLSTAQQSLTNLGLPVDADAVEAIANDRLMDYLRFFGLPKSIAAGLDPKTTTAGLLPLIAPFDGVVVARDVVAGEVVDTSKVLFVVVDLRQMWLTLDLRLEDARRVSLGRPVRFQADGSKEESVGSVSWISTEADHKTRTIKVRALLANTDGRLKANTFGAGRVVLREEPEAVVVPSAAIHWEGDCHVVFVRDKDFLKEGLPKVFHTRVVRPGATDGQNTEIIAGVLPGEVIAVRGSPSLRAELLRGNLGEG